MRIILKTLFIILTSIQLYGQTQNFSTEGVVNYLSSEELKGRRAGTFEEKEAAQYIKDKFIEIGILPLEKDFISSFPFSEKLDKHDTLGVTRTGHNIIAQIDNNQTKTVVIAAHYDHLGEGFHPSSRETDSSGKIHYGADDNASGVAGMLSIANYLNNNKRVEKNNYIFISFSAEELGLFGSKHWLENSGIDLSNIIAMINLDMIGRLDTLSKQLEIFGTGTTASWNEIIDASKNDFKIKKISSGIGASDHNSFYLKGIPALHIFTGTHEDYHKSTDTAEKINFKGINSIVTFVTLLLEEVESKASLPFQKTKTSGDSKRAKMKVTMGIIPSYIANEKGLNIDGVLSEKPAEMAGLQEGDIIIEINNNPINDIYDYMEQLSLFDPGDKTTVKVLRGETTKLFTIKF
jgi:hypothetical protein